jgi:hypothetical protein
MGLNRAQAKYLALKVNGIAWLNVHPNAICELTEKILENFGGASVFITSLLPRSD